MKKTNSIGNKKSGKTGKFNIGYSDLDVIVKILSYEVPPGYTLKKIAGVFSGLLSSVSCISSCRVCFPGLHSSKGKFDDSLCKDCELMEEKSDNAFVSGKFVCRQERGNNKFIYKLKSGRKYYGIIALEIENEDKFKLITPYIRKTVNRFAGILENRVQNLKIEKAFEKLEIELESKTRVVKNAEKQLKEKLSESISAQERFAKSEGLFSFLFESMTQGVVIQDAESRIIEVNNAACGILGLTRKQMMGVSAYDPKWKLIHDDGSDFFPEEMPSNIALKTGKPAGQVLIGVYIPRNDSYNWILTSSTPKFKNGKKKPYLTLTTFTDITVRKKTLESLKKREEELRKAQKLGRIGNWSWDMKSDRIEWSEEYYEIFGFNTEMPPPGYEKHLKAYTPESAKVLDDAVKRNIETGEPYDVDLELAAKNAPCRWINAISETIKDSKGNIVGLRGTAQDITDRKRIEEEKLKNLRFYESLNSINRVIQASDDMRNMISDIFDEMLNIFDCDRVWLVYPCDPDYEFLSTVMERTKVQYPGVFSMGIHLPIKPNIKTLLRILLNSQNPVCFGSGYKNKLPDVLKRKFGVKSQIAAAIYPKTGKPYVLGMHQCSYAREWSDADAKLFHEISWRITDALTGFIIKNNLKESELKYRTIYEESFDGLFLTSPDGKILDMNKKGVELFGYETKDEILKLDLERDVYAYPPDRKRILEMVNSKGTAEYEVIVKKKNGERIYTYCSLTAVRNFEGTIESYRGIIRDITEKKKVEERNAMLNFAINYVRESAFVIDNKSKFFYVNDEACRKLGYTKDELLALSVPDIDPGFPMSHWNEHWNNLKKNRAMVFEGQHKTKSGNLIPVEINANFFEYEGREYNLSLVRDISDRKRIENLIRSQNKRLQVLSVNAQNINTVLEIPVILRKFVSAAIILTGAEAGSVGLIENNKIVFKEYFKRNKFYPLDLVLSPGEGVSGCVLSSKKTFLSNDSSNINHPLKMEDENEILRNIAAIPIFNYKNEVLGCLEIHNKFGDFEDQDVTLLKGLAASASIAVENAQILEARIKAEEEIKKLSRAIEQSPSTIIITDLEGNVEYANPKFSESTGYSFEEIYGKNPRILKSGETPDNEYSVLWKTITKGGEWRGEFHNKKKNGELFWEAASISPIRNLAGEITHYLAIKEDITEKKLKEMELIQAKEKAEEMNRLKSSFLANMSHELRTPMVAILGFSEELFEVLNENDKKEMAGIILKGGKRLMNTLNLILDLSRIESSKKEVFISNENISDIVFPVIKMFENEALKKNLKIIPKVDKPVFANVDISMLEKITENIIQNAIKYTVEGGITVITGYELFNGVESPYLRIEDTGIGIPGDMLEVIFEPFRQVSEGWGRSYEGTGLGLSITKKYTELMGGMIFVESEIGKGSAFTVRFRPGTGTVSADIVKQTELKSDYNDKRVNCNTRILIAEDDELCLKIMEYEIGKICDYDIVKTGEDAVNSVMKNNYSAILMDICLKGMSGLEAVKRIRNIKGYESVPIVALTAFAMSGDKEEFLKGGCSHYLSKPFAVNDLLNLVKSLVSETC